MDRETPMTRRSEGRDQPAPPGDEEGPPLLDLVGVGRHVDLEIADLDQLWRFLHRAPPFALLPRQGYRRATRPAIRRNLGCTVATLEEAYSLGGRLGPRVVEVLRAVQLAGS